MSNKNLFHIVHVSLDLILIFVVIVISSCAPAGFTPARTSGPADTQAPAVAPTSAGAQPTVIEYKPPTDPSLPGIKPALAFSKPMAGLSEQSIAYTFPAGTPGGPIAIRVSPLGDIQKYVYGPPENWKDLTPIGLVEIGPGSDSGQPESGIYLVAIDLAASTLSVRGMIFPLITANTAYELNFQRISQELNLARFKSSVEAFAKLDPPQSNNAAINADGVCFVFSISSNVYTRYCSEPGSVLSVRKNFASKYERLYGSIYKAALNFGMENQIQTDYIISEMEDPGRIQDCSGKIDQGSTGQDLQTSCGSDITAVPVKQNPSQANVRVEVGSRSQTVGVVQVLNPINTVNGTVLPGDYRLDYWYDENNVFYAASITGTAIGNGNERINVIDQQVPAVPASFVNTDNPPQGYAEISACRIFGYCVFWQRTCP